MEREQALRGGIAHRVTRGSNPLPFSRSSRARREISAALFVAVGFERLPIDQQIPRFHLARQVHDDCACISLPIADIGSTFVTDTLCAERSPDAVALLGLEPNLRVIRCHCGDSSKSSRACGIRL